MKVFSAAIIFAVAMFSAYAAKLYDEPDNHHIDSNYCVDVACVDKMLENVKLGATVVESLMKCVENAKPPLKQATKMLAQALVCTSNLYKEIKEQSLSLQTKYRMFYDDLHKMNTGSRLLVKYMDNDDVGWCLTTWFEENKELVHHELNICWKEAGAEECKEERQ